MEDYNALEPHGEDARSRCHEVHLLKVTLPSWRVSVSVCVRVLCVCVSLFLFVLSRFLNFALSSVLRLPPSLFSSLVRFKCDAPEAASQQMLNVVWAKDIRMPCEPALTVWRRRQDRGSPSEHKVDACTRGSIVLLILSCHNLTSGKRPSVHVPTYLHWSKIWRYSGPRCNRVLVQWTAGKPCPSPYLCINIHPLCQDMYSVR